MKKGTLVITSTILVIIGLVLLVSSLSITGNVVSEKIGKTPSSILGLAFIIGGVVLFMARRSKEGNLAKQVLESGAVLSRPRDIKKIARKMGYEIVGNKREGYTVLYEKGRLTTIPGHISKETFYSIMKALATRKPNLRRRADYSTS
jgi:hypothetical protein